MEQFGAVQDLGRMGQYWVFKILIKTSLNYQYQDVFEIVINEIK
jgi:hypothetical protein